MDRRYSVRNALDSDLPGILTIERAGFGEWAWDRNLFADYKRKCGELFLVAEAGEKVVGYCIGCIARNAASLESIAVAPSMKGKGVADALLRGLLLRLRRRGIGRVGLMVKVTNLRAMGFYEKSGFRRVRRVPHYYEDGEDGVLYRLNW
jgi:ribosomal-protein-alanine N-acetyltransferase